MTEEALEAKKWRMVEARSKLKAHVSSLQNELGEFVKSWRKLSDVDCGPSADVYSVDSSKIEVLRLDNSVSPRRIGSPERNAIISVKAEHFDFERIKELFLALNEARKELSEITVQVRDLNIPLEDLDLRT